MFTIESSLLYLLSASGLVLLVLPLYRLSLSTSGLILLDFSQNIPHAYSIAKKLAIY